MDERVVQTPKEMGQALAEFLRELPAQLGRRATVLVPREAIAHELRRQIILLPQGAGLLAGVVFTRPVALAAEICARAGLRLSAGQEQCWPAVLDLCIEQNHPALAGLTYYRPEHLREHEGYPRALAQSLSLLDAAGLSASDLASVAERLNGTHAARMADLARLRGMLDESLPDKQENLLTSPALLRRAASIVQAQGTFGMGPFLSVRLLDGPAEQQTLEQALDCRLLTLVNRLEAISLPSFELSLHAGATDELEAACLWAERQIVEEGRNLGQLAFACAQPSQALPLARMLVRHLGLSAHPDQLLMDGLPMSSTWAGSSLLTALDLIVAGMPRQALAEWLFGLAPQESRAKIHDALSRSGERGGHPGSFRAWSKTRRHLPARIGQALASLVVLGRLMATDADLDQMRNEGLDPLLALYETDPHLESIRVGLEQSLDILRQAGLDIRGRNLVRHIHQSLQAIHVHKARFGHPLPLVGSLASFAGLCFEAMRLVGLVEGSIPQTAQEDPVLPDFLRSEILAAQTEPPTPCLRLRSQEQIEARQMAELSLAGITSALATSAALQQLDGQQLEPSTFLLELAGRAQASPVPMISAKGLAQAAEASRAKLEAWMKGRARTIEQLAEAGRGQAGRVRLPETWWTEPQFGLKAMVELFMRTRGDQDWLKSGFAMTPNDLKMPGLQPEPGLAITRLSTLLGCPMRFALEALAGLQSPSAFPTPWELDPPTFGSTLHKAAEHLFGQETPAVLQGDDEAAWFRRAEDAAEQALARTEGHYVLEGPEVRARVLRRLVEMLQGLMTFYGQGHVDKLVTAEHWLGSPSVPCPTPAGTLHLRGKIDLLWQDREGDLLVHDIKSGKVAHFDEHKGFDLDRDLQVLTYAACLQAGDQNVSEVGLIFPSAGSKAEARRHRANGLEQGMDWAREMLATAHKLLSTRAFAPLPDDEKRCARCPFASTCEQDWRQQAQAQVQKAAGHTKKLPEELAALVALLRAREGETSS